MLNVKRNTAGATWIEAGEKILDGLSGDENDNAMGYFRHARDLGEDRNEMKSIT